MDSDLHPLDDYSHRFFIWHEWIQANGPLTRENVFDYFATSMFYDKQSNNQVLRMQTMHTGMPVVNEAEELKRFTGVEFALIHAVPPTMFIIHKRERMSPEEVRPLAAYFIMNNRIYQSPDLYTVLSNRLLTSLYALQSSLDTLRKHRPDYTPRTGFVWPIVDPSMEGDVNKKQAANDSGKIEPDLSGTEKRKQQLDSPTLTPLTTKKQQNNMLLLNAMRTTAMHSDLSFSNPLATGSESEIAPETGDLSSSITPAPPASQVATPPTNAPTPRDLSATKVTGGPAKKKKKRTSVAHGVS